jgi:small subunit ribosomal protein S6
MIIKNEYETIYLSKAELSDDIQNEVQEKIAAIITEKGGEILVNEKWGKRKMAYEIQKKRYANYVLLDYVGTAELPFDIERAMRLDDRFIRFLTVKLEDDVDMEAVKEAAQIRHKRRQDKMNNNA